MTGKTSLFPVWRSELADSDRIRDAASARIRIWAEFRDRIFPASSIWQNSALEIYDGLEALKLTRFDPLPEARCILESAVLARAVGFSITHKKRQVESYRLIRKIGPPLGLDGETLRHIALVVRFHRGSLPRPEQKAWSGISDTQRKSLVLLSGILRLADAFDRLHGRRIYRLEMKKSGDTLFITAPGYDENDSSAEACGRPSSDRNHMPVADPDTKLTIEVSGDDSLFAPTASIQPRAKQANREASPVTFMQSRAFFRCCNR